MYLLLEKEYFQPAMLDYWSAVVYPFISTLMNIKALAMNRA